MPDDDENLKEWINELDEEEPTRGDIDRFMRQRQGNQEDRQFETSSQEFQQYRQAEVRSNKRTWYERLVDRTSFFSMEFEDTREEHEQAIRLLQFDIEPEDIFPSALFMLLLLLPAAVSTTFLNMPTPFKGFFLIIPFAVFYYILKYPSLKAKEKVVKSSEELILSVLYMVVYMRSAPTLEGAIAFAAQRLDGPVSRDLNEILWKMDMRVYNSVEEGVLDYVERWKPYNRGFVQSLTLLQSAVTAKSDTKRKEILQESVDNLLGFTKDQMDDFARDIQMPVMILHGLGILLPILGIMLFPMIATFMGGENMIINLAFLYNIIIPITVYVIMRNLLVSRPVSFSSESGHVTDEKKGSLTIAVAGKEFEIGWWIVTLPVAALLLYLPVSHYGTILLTDASVPVSPPPGVLLQEVMFGIGLAVPVGLHLVLKYGPVIDQQEEVGEMEAEFPEILYELGNELEKGKPMERAIATAAETRRGLEISDLFKLISDNIREQGMTFRQAVFDKRSGAMQRYPSKLMRTILEVISESINKGPQVTARSILSISNYLKNIQDTQKKLEELLDETVTSLQFLGYIMAPVIAGIAVGMGGVISQAFWQIGSIFEERGGNVSTDVDAGPVGGTDPGPSAGLLDVFGVESAIPPGVLQLVIAIYLIQLSYLLGALMVQLKYGNNRARKLIAVGKILIVSSIVYSIIVLVIFVVFGGIISSVSV